MRLLTHTAFTNYSVFKRCSCVRNPFLAFSIWRSLCPSLHATPVLEAHEIYFILLPEDDTGPSFPPFPSSFSVAVSVPLCETENRIIIYSRINHSSFKTHGIFFIALLGYSLYTKLHILIVQFDELEHCLHPWHPPHDEDVRRSDFQGKGICELQQQAHWQSEGLPRHNGKSNKWIKIHISMFR